MQDTMTRHSSTRHHDQTAAAQGTMTRQQQHKTPWQDTTTKETMTRHSSTWHHDKTQQHMHHSEHHDKTQQHMAPWQDTAAQDTMTRYSSTWHHDKTQSQDTAARTPDWTPWQDPAPHRTPSQDTGHCDMTQHHTGHHHKTQYTVTWQHYTGHHHKTQDTVTRHSTTHDTITRHHDKTQQHMSLDRTPWQDSTTLGTTQDTEAHAHWTGRHDKTWCSIHLQDTTTRHTMQHAKTSPKGTWCSIHLQDAVCICKRVRQHYIYIQNGITRHMMQHGFTYKTVRHHMIHKTHGAAWLYRKVTHHKTLHGHPELNALDSDTPP